jgi:hypothetical protein
MKLGKLAPKPHPLTLRLPFRADAPPAPPEKLWREYKIPDDVYGMFGNDTIGDCTCAAIAHLLMLVTAHTGGMVIPTLDDVISVYSAVSGYDPSTGANDNGAAITDVLNYWKTTGLAGHKILAWAALPTDTTSRQKSMYIFGGNDLGVQLPQSAMDQFEAGQTWTPVADSPILGGHSIVEAGYGSEGSDVGTWGKGTQKATNDWGTQYIDEAYVVVTKDWLNNADGLAPNQLDLDQLRTLLAQM